MRKYCFNLFLLLMFGSTINAQNLVSNPSFEDYISCPSDVIQIYKAIGWSSYGFTPDYFNACSNPATVGTPQNLWGYQAALDGTAYAGLSLFEQYFLDHSREYMGTKLIHSLTPGVKYFVSAYVSRGDYEMVNGASNNFGFRFSNVTYEKTNPAPTNNISHYHDTTIILDSKNWTRISGSFIADTAYQYLILGNFYDDQHTKTVNMDHNYAYVYVDFVCVSTDSLEGVWSNGDSGDGFLSTDVYPSPFQDELYVRVNNTDPSEITLYDAAVKEVLKETFIQKAVLKMTMFAQGVYIYKIKNRGGIIKEGKIVKR